MPLKITGKDYTTDSAISDIVFREEFGEFLEGGVYLIKSQVDVRLKDILDYHRERHKGTTILHCEELNQDRIEIPDLGWVDIKGRVDRIGNEIVILDYKTGSTAQRPQSRGFSLEKRENWHKRVGSVQLPFYILFYLTRETSRNVNDLNGGLMLLKPRAIDEKFLFGENDDRRAVYELCREVIFRLVREILDPGLKFTPTQNPEDACGPCAYKVMCSRQWVRSRWQRVHV